MEEIIINLHMHTRYSDGSGLHRDIVEAAARAGLDGVIVTDHNVWVQGVEGYRETHNRRILLLVGEEVHDRMRNPQKNHLLVIGANRELSPLAGSPQRVIDAARQAGGLTFIAHPNDPALPMFGEDDISWEDWEVYGFTGLELWNGFSELKNVIRFRLQAFFYAFFPQFVAHGPIPATLQRWDALLQQGQPIVAVGGSDAHALHLRAGCLRRIVFPYEFHFRAINTHVLLPEKLSGDFNTDKQSVLTALRQGHCFIGYDLPASTRGFRFTAQGRSRTVVMGDSLDVNGGVTLQIRLPQAAECRLIKDGQVIKVWKRQEVCTWITQTPGVYRVECYLPYLGRRRGWIFSNPIYLKPGRG
jgi:hypothetical protein